MSFWRVSMSGHVDGHRPKAQIGDMEGERGHLRGTDAPSMHKDNQRPIPPNPSDIVLAVAHLARLRHRFLVGGRNGRPLRHGSKERMMEFAVASGTTLTTNLASVMSIQISCWRSVQ